MGGCSHTNPQQDHPRVMMAWWKHILNNASEFRSSNHQVIPSWKSTLDHTFVDIHMSFFWGVLLICCDPSNGAIQQTNLDSKITLKKVTTVYGSEIPRPTTVWMDKKTLVNNGDFNYQPLNWVNLGFLNHQQLHSRNLANWYQKFPFLKGATGFPRPIILGALQPLVLGSVPPEKWHRWKPRETRETRDTVMLYESPLASPDDVTRPFPGGLTTLSAVGNVWDTQRYKVGPKKPAISRGP